MLSFRRSSVALLVFLLLPAAAFAQAAITGVVKDTSGAVLPGVTVEAASPVLIEKVRSVVSDDRGQYRIVALPPGTYSVTFALPGFSTVKRDGIELTGTFVATVNGDLKVGALEETITVTGETPIVDVQSARVQQTVSKEILAAIPSSRTATGIQALIPGMNTSSDAGGASGASGGATGAIHGGRAYDSNMLNDGLTTTYANWNGGGGNNANVAGAQEIVVSTSGGLGEAEKGGVSINLIPREGGNTFSGTFVYSGANGAMQGSNYTQELKDRGLASPQEILKVYDFNPMGGGRIIRDKLWFYNTLRVWGADNTVPGMYWNKNAGDPTKWTYEPDLSRPTSKDNQNGTAVARLTWQATPRNKLTAYWSEQWNLGNTKFRGGSAVLATEAQGRVWYHPSRVVQTTWSSPLTSRVLMEAGAGIYEARYSNNAPRTDGTHNRQLIQVVEQAGSIPGLTYRFPETFGHSTIGTHSWRASVSYVTGAHNMKFGYFGSFNNPISHSWSVRDDGIVAYRFRNGVPNRFTLRAGNPLPGGARFVQTNRNAITTSFYGQDQWTAGRLTLQGGVRYDHYIYNAPEQRLADSPLVPVPIVFPSRSTPGVHWDDITPRMGAAYDLFGNGKTAVKGNLGKYPLAQGASSSGDFDLNPLSRIGVSTTRSWTDTNKNYVPDCDLANPAKNGECGAYANQNFGKNVFSTSFDPALVNGWGVRPYNWELVASVQQELIPRVSVNVGYFRRWFGNFFVIDNRAIGPSDYDPFSIPVAADARLPDGGGSTISDQYDLKPEKFGQVDNNKTSANNFGKQIENWHGVDVTVSARLRNGLTVQGGTSTGRRLTDECDVRPKVDNPSRRFCRVVEPFLTQIRGLATYTIPRIDVQVSGTFQSNPGPELAANYDVPTAVVKPSLGRDLSGNAANVTVNLVPPATLYGDRNNQLDFKISKILRFGRTKSQIGVDLYNATNTGVPLSFNQTYVPGGAWLAPNSILVARYAKISVQVDF